MEMTHWQNFDVPGCPKIEE